VCAGYVLGALGQQLQGGIEIAIRHGGKGASALFSGKARASLGCLWLMRRDSGDTRGDTGRRGSTCAGLTVSLHRGHCRSLFGGGLMIHF
jgi:hypothetical protein